LKSCCHRRVETSEVAAALRRDTSDLNRQRAVIDKIIMRAITATGVKASPPHLAG